MADAIMSGYDPAFLDVAVALPQPDSGSEVRDLPYVHFTVLLDPARKLAVATAVNIDGELLQDLERGDDWRYDDRIPEAEQTGPEVYANNDLDRGHLVRRRDPVWGDLATAQAANDDSFTFTNAAPQAGPFNQGRRLWVGLEDHVLEFARANRNRVSVYTGPVLAPSDPPYRGIQIPLLFWKVAAWTTVDGDETVLRSAGFVLDQSPSLDDIELPRVIGEVPPLGAFETFQVPVAQIAELTGLEFGPLVDADVMEPVPVVGEVAEGRGVWMRLESMGAVRL